MLMSYSRMLFHKLQLNPSNVKVLSGSLIGLFGEQVQVRGHVTLETTCGGGVDAKAIDVSYYIRDALSPCNIILGRLVINVLRAVISTLYLGRSICFLEGELEQFKEISISLKNVTRIA